MLAILVAAVVITYCYVKHGNFIKEENKQKMQKQDSYSFKIP